MDDSDRRRDTDRDRGDERKERVEPFYFRYEVGDCEWYGGAAVVVLVVAVVDERLLRLFRCWWASR